MSWDDLETTERLVSPTFHTHTDESYAIRECEQPLSGGLGQFRLTLRLITIHTGWYVACTQESETQSDQAAQS
jgi:hypothetical protein